MSLVLFHLSQFTFWQRDDRLSDFQEKGQIIHSDVQALTNFDNCIFSCTGFKMSAESMMSNIIRQIHGNMYN